MVQRATAAASGLFLDVMRIRGLQNERLSLPVKPAYSTYARFEHIRGVPAADGAVPIFKLRILDKLIDRLLSYGESPAVVQSLSSSIRLGGAEALDPLESRLRQRVLGQPALFGGQFSAAGMLVDLVA